MISKEITKAYIKLHLAVFLFGMTAILGKMITMEQMGLVWNRLWISSLGLLFIPGVIQGLKILTQKQFLIFTGIGIIVALHWVAFYGSIKLGNSASITLACMATTPLFTSFLEPLIVKRRLLKTEVILGIITIVGVYFVSGAGEMFYPAMVVGIISALLGTIFSILNKRFAGEHNAISISFLELTAGFLFLSLLLPFYFYLDNNFSIAPDLSMKQEVWNFTFANIHSDWYYLIILGILCTSLGFVFALQSLKYLSAFVSNLSINLEPVYGIILAVFIFQENKDLNLKFYMGTAIILSCVLLHPILKRIERRRLSKASGLNEKVLL